MDLALKNENQVALHKNQLCEWPTLDARLIKNTFFIRSRLPLVFMVYSKYESLRRASPRFFMLRKVRKHTIQLRSSLKLYLNVTFPCGIFRKCLLHPLPYCAILPFSFRTRRILSYFEISLWARLHEWKVSSLLFTL